jgi:hypothetical protein
MPLSCLPRNATNGSGAKSRNLSILTIHRGKPRLLKWRNFRSRRFTQIRWPATELLAAAENAEKPELRPAKALVTASPMRKGAPVGPSPNTYPSQPAPELAWCETVAWIVGGIFAAMFVTWVVLELVSAAGRWRRTRRAARFVAPRP